MRFRSWPVAAIGMAGLLLLLAFAVTSASRRAAEIFARLERANDHHHDVEARLRQLRADVHLSGIFIRDYLLDHETSRAEDYRARLTQFRVDNRETLARVQTLLQSSPDARERLVALESSLADYWRGFETVVDWTPEQKLRARADFVRTEMLPKRESALTIARQVEQLNHASLDEERFRMNQQLAAFQDGMGNLLWGGLLLGAVVTVASVYRLRSLEHRALRGHAAAEAAEVRARQLSQQLVATQEEERRRLSRELHDHLGQMLSALRLELGRIDRLRVQTNQPAAQAIVESRQLVDEMVTTVRDLAMGLRPSMLDDLGLVPALEWQVRDFTRRFEIRVDLNVSADLEGLPEQYRTCIYRVIQEALTNCARHSGASQIVIALVDREARLEILIKDDGVGMDAGVRAEGLGIRGMEERVLELDGRFDVQSTVGKGTTIRINLPMTRKAGAVAAGHR